MAEPTPVNGQITDAVTQAKVEVLGDAPAMALGNLYQGIAQSLATAAANAVNAQQQANEALQATTAQAVARLLSNPS